MGTLVNRIETAAGSGNQIEQILKPDRAIPPMVKISGNWIDQPKIDIEELKTIIDPDLMGVLDPEEEAEEGRET